MTTVIDDARPVFTLINTFTATAENVPKIVASLMAFTQRTTMHRPGFVGTSIHVSRDGTRVVNYVQWADDASFQAMFADPAAQEHMDEVRSLATSVDPVRYDVVYVGSRARR
jgi:quinol monooxygenase YgiN